MLSSYVSRPVVSHSGTLPRPFTKRKLSGRQLMCQKQAVKFSHVIHIRSEEEGGGRERGGGGEEEEEEGERGGMEGATSQRLV